MAGVQRTQILSGITKFKGNIDHIDFFPSYILKLNAPK